MERVGKYFEFGAPYFDGGVSYNWPNCEIDYDKLFLEKKDEMGDMLIDKLKGYIGDFRVFTSVPHYPHLQDGEKGLALHLGDGGRWIEIWKMMGASFLGEHNLDAYSDRAACFNIGSDVLEYLDPSVLAPRISVEESYVMRYPLPEGLVGIEHEYFNKETFNRFYGMMDLDTDIKFINELGNQRIENADGIITIKDGVCEGRGFKGWHAPKASLIISKLMALCKKDY